MKDSSEHIFYCNYYPNEIKKRGAVFLNYISSKDFDANVNINLPQFTNSVYHLTDRIKDLLELASYIFSADRLVERGNKDALEYHSWSRRIKFNVKVRDYKFWNNDEIKKSLSILLRYMSGDYEYSFNFTSGHSTTPTSLFDEKDFSMPINDPTSVLLFSGGLDSLGGAIEKLESTQENICLISHRSQSRIKRTQDQLVEYLTSKYKDRIYHYKFECNLHKINSIEETQRTRSFLYSSIAFSIANAYDIDNLYVYENGITGMNFSKRGDMLNARASRTTHPKTLYLLEKFFSCFGKTKLVIKNPFLFKTKTDVINILHSYGVSQLISSAVSCGRGKLTFSEGTHCGECSQCIDRRLAIYASSIEAKNDIDAVYSQNIIEDRITSNETKVTLLDYLRQAHEFNSYTINQFYSEKINELSDLVGYIESYDEYYTVEMIYQLVRRHGSQIEISLSNMRQFYDKPFTKVEKDSLISIINEKKFLKESVNYSSVIKELYGINPGKADAKKYEVLVEKILMLLFDPILVDPHSQVKTIDGRECIDITFHNKADKGFWKDVKDKHGNIVVIFEVKNMTKLSNTELDQISSRLNDKKGMLGFIVCRNYEDKDIERSLRKILKNEFILFIRDADFEAMLAGYEINKKPTEYIEKLYRDFVERI